MSDQENNGEGFEEFKRPCPESPAIRCNRCKYGDGEHGCLVNNQEELTAFKTEENNIYKAYIQQKRKLNQLEKENENLKSDVSEIMSAIKHHAKTERKLKKIAEKMEKHFEDIANIAFRIQHDEERKNAIKILKICEKY